MNELSDYLTSKGVEIIGTKFKCPFHDDNNPSGSIYQNESGKWKAHCFACGYDEDMMGIAAKYGERVGLKPNKTNIKTYTIEDIKEMYPDIEDMYMYTNPSTKKADMLVVRYINSKTGKKSFSQFKPLRDRWVAGAPPTPRPIAMRSALLKSNYAIVVEGEKAAKALLSIGITATTSPGGVNGARHADWTPLKNKKVFVWPDNDEPGKAYAMEVISILRSNITEDVKLVPPFGDKGDDAYDFIALGKTKEDVREYLKSSSSVNNLSELTDMYESMIAGEFISLSLPWKTVTDKAKPCFPSTVTVIVGRPNSGKSFLTMDMMRYFFKKNIPFSCLELEDSKAIHLMRALAQESGVSGMADDQWVKAHPEQCREIVNEYSGWLDSFAGNIEMPKDLSMSYDDMLAWAEQEFKSGSKIIIIDPITALTSEDAVYTADKNMMRHMRRLVNQYKTTAIFVTHTKQQACGTEFSDIAGGASISNFAQCILSLSSMPVVNLDVQTSDHCPNFQTQEMPVNRVLGIKKARLSSGGGLELGFLFDSKTLRNIEQGVIIKKKRGKNETLL